MLELGDTPTQHGSLQTEGTCGGTVTTVLDHFGEKKHGVQVLHKVYQLLFYI